jgi:hypothetical protein
MKTNEPSVQFWAVLGVVNILTLIYPVILLHRVKSVEDDIFANLVLLGSLLLLAVVNAVSIVIAQAAGADKR